MHAKLLVALVSCLVAGHAAAQSKTIAITSFGAHPALQANVHPDGLAVSTGSFPSSALEPSPRFDEIVRAFEGHGERVESPDDLSGALAHALDGVRKEHRQALVNIVCRR